MNRSLAFALPTIDLHWAVETRYAHAQLALLQTIGWEAHAREFRLQMEQQDPEPEAARRGGDDADDKPFEFSGGVALLSLSGPMTKRPQSFSDGASTVRMRRLVRQAAADPDVTAIVMVIDSPGGQVSGTKELADDLAAARARKPVAAYIEDLGASAAYWVAAQADAIYANETAFVGSIGTYCVVRDYSRMAANEGIKVHVLSTGPYKGAGYPGAEVTDQQLAHWQHEVNQINETFLAAVAKGRSFNLDFTRAVADGRTHIAREAESIGLIDGVRTLESVVTDLQRGQRPLRRQSAP
jgi:signal peptide peptidase SppA